MLIFLNLALVFAFFKLKEYQNARILSEQMIAKLDRQVMFSVKEESNGLFPFRYMLAASLHEVKQQKECLKLLYRLRKDAIESFVEVKIRPSEGGREFKNESPRKANLMPAQEEEEDEFGSLKKEAPKQLDD
mmetsp:Transcript_25125/g.18917  ORF Transcript_25125/g.18917 Transcript_25125/m.18917 type:complete len:132 (+) Transcript_25125:307-702(+)